MTFGTVTIDVCPFCHGRSIPLSEREVINTHYCEDCGHYLQPRNATTENNENKESEANI